MRCGPVFRQSHRLPPILPEWAIALCRAITDNRTNAQHPEHQPMSESTLGQAKFGKGCHLHLIDGSAFIFRAYHALPPLTRKSDGLPIGAVAGFCNMLHRYVEGNTGPDAPTHVAVIFDHSGKSFRNDMYDLYKPPKICARSSR
jgi:hypothetical protein